MTSSEQDATRGVMVALTEEEARHTYLWLRASTVPMGMDEPGLRAAWERTPVGTAAAKLEAALAPIKKGQPE